jgi:hypothetical protein
MPIDVLVIGLAFAAAVVGVVVTLVFQWKTWAATSNRQFRWSVFCGWPLDVDDFQGLAAKHAAKVNKAMLATLCVFIIGIAAVATTIGNSSLQVVAAACVVWLTLLIGVTTMYLRRSPNGEAEH